jgi:lipopolysaccharide/colanic/teichoic acid biosynthesis glycosyltransferase
VNRAFDVAGAGVGLVLTSPILGLAALAIKLEDGGPVLYRQTRVGQGGREFELLKLRTMVADAEELKSAVSDRNMHNGSGENARMFKIPNDPRITRVGSFMRRWSIDELPQLWNVLRGEMSLVGPRPEDPTLVAVAPEAYETILAVPGGITGLSQLAFAKEGSILSSEDRVQDYLERLFPQKIGLDRMYATKRSFLTNLRILYWTLAAVFGADVAVDRKTAALRRRRRPKPTRARVESVAEPAVAVDELAAGRT